MKTGAALIGTAILWLASPMPAAADEPPCKPEHSVGISFHEAIIDADDFIGKCVRIRGFVAHRALLASLKSYYIVRSGQTLDYVDVEQIAIYGGPGIPQTDDTLWAMRGTAELSGRLTTCARLYSQNEAEIREYQKTHPDAVIIHMMGGLCHYRGGPVIMVDAYREVAGLPTRLSGESNRAIYGDLSPFDGTAPDFAARRATVEDWFAALRARDIGRLAKLGRRDLTEYALKTLPDPARSAFAALLGAPATPPISYFRPHLRAWDTDYRIYGCVCIRGDCADQWPIDSMDTGSTNDPPYRCVIARGDGRVEEAY